MQLLFEFTRTYHSDISYFKTAVKHKYHCAKRKKFKTAKKCFEYLFCAEHEFELRSFPVTLHIFVTLISTFFKSVHIFLTAGTTF